MKTKTIDTTTRRGLNRLNMHVWNGKWRAVKVGKFFVTIQRAS